jgi:hypothetical protein
METIDSGRMIPSARIVTSTFSSIVSMANGITKHQTSQPRDAPRSLGEARFRAIQCASIMS